MIKKLLSQDAFGRGYMWFSNLFTFIGILALFLSFDGLFDFITCWFTKLVCILLTVVVVYVIMHGIAFWTYYEKQKRIREVAISELGSNNKLYIKFGDLLGDEITKSEKRTNIVIPFNRCFDIEVNDSLISRNSLHGKIVNRLIESKKYDKNTLQEVMNAALRRVSNHSYVPEIVDKKFGNCVRYPVGAVASIPGIHNEYYFCLGLSKFNQEKAEPSKSEYQEALDRLVQRIVDLSQGYPVFIPLIGTGLSGVCADDKLALDILIHTIKLRKEEIKCDIYIVLREELKPLVEKLMHYV